MKQVWFMVIIITIAGLTFMTGCGKGRTQKSSTAANISRVVIRDAMTDEVGQKRKCVMDSMDIEVTKGSKVAEFNGNTYYFCAAGEELEFAKK